MIPGEIKTNNFKEIIRMKHELFFEDKIESKNYKTILGCRESGYFRDPSPFFSKSGCSNLKSIV